MYTPIGEYYWEVKPISYYTDPKRAKDMEDQMRRYDKDGVNRGAPLGYTEFDFLDYDIKVYSMDVGKIYYTFQKEQQKQSVIYKFFTTGDPSGVEKGVQIIQTAAG